MLAIKSLTAVRKTKDDAVASEIIPGLYLGSIGAAFNKKTLEGAGITHILTCAGNLKPRYPDEYKYMLLPLQDSCNENIAKYFRQANEFIREALDQTTDESVL